MGELIKCIQYDHFFIEFFIWYRWYIPKKYRFMDEFEEEREKIDNEVRIILGGGKGRNIFEIK